MYCGYTLQKVQIIYNIINYDKYKKAVVPCVKKDRHLYNQRFEHKTSINMYLSGRKQFIIKIRRVLTFSWSRETCKVYRRTFYVFIVN